ncbi:MAG: DUF1553 domain-containing protein, partial [Planctomycetaceae bacterium]
TGDDRLVRWTEKMLLRDPRFADYFAERLARGFVGTDEGQFVVYRRDRFSDWLSEQLAENRPYDEIVRQIISEDGLWTGRPASNFVTAAVLEGDFDENELAGRTVRAFLGQRIDCAQCHDHPFDDWTQQDFEGLAAHYGQVRLSMVGVTDKTEQDGRPIEYHIEDPLTESPRTVAPQVPFGEEWLPDEGTRRERLAAWVTHPENRRFERAIANRVWGLMFGKAYLEPVDDLPDPPTKPGFFFKAGLLDLLGEDFREQGYDLRRLIHVIAASRPFRLASTYAADDPDQLAEAELQWAVFPLTRLRPEQVIGSMIQATSVKTIDQNSHLVTRFIRLTRESDFVNQYGDLGENELVDRTGTIPQALLRMNGRLAQETLGAGPFNASGRIAAMAGSDEECLEACYLVCLTRRPAAEERQHFLPLLRGTKGKQRQQAVEDIYWPLFNSIEFSWNH